MLPSPQAQFAERPLSSVDLFCMQTYEPAKKDPVRRARGITMALGGVCLVLLAGLGMALWQGNALAQERNLLAQELRLERAAHVRTTLAAKDVEQNVANFALETTVRRDIVDERMLEQERRSAELAQLADQVERDKLARADCATPRSILAAANL